MKFKKNKRRSHQELFKIPKVNGTTYWVALLDEIKAFKRLIAGVAPFISLLKDKNEYDLAYKGMQCYASFQERDISPEVPYLVVGHSSTYRVGAFRHLNMKSLFLTFLLLLSISMSFAQKHKTKNVILISIDGYRWQEVFRGADSSILSQKKYSNQSSSILTSKYWAPTQEKRREKLMPFFWGVIARQGQLYGNRDLSNKVDVKNKYWFSYPGRSETICGYVDTAINSNDYPDNPNENILEFINKQKGYENKVATIAGWNSVARIVNRNRNHMPLINPYEDVKGENLTEAQKLANEIQHYMPLYFGKAVRFDVSTYAIAKSYITANHPKLIYIDFVDPDDFGHSGKYDFYLDAGHYLDAMIKNIWETIQADPFYRNNTTIMIYPDHGRGIGDEWVDHGSETPHSNETWMAILGPDTPAKGEIKTHSQIYQDQFAQTVAQLLGFKFSANHPVANAVESALK